ncbi:MAG: hypothetical protein CVU42_10930 [Chloroflexi bacterium HGW-Chloroflexi-4]|jgi:tetratricopeptide (TPR) repeat protein|nr:MAG: hypothetical protein CVU42_10930 [Chloroflexi bacterium HGW-Chloroflexi-4]
MKLKTALSLFAKTKIFEVLDSDGEPENWKVKPLASKILIETEGYFNVKGINILPDGKAVDCYMDISLPERINDLVYFREENSLREEYPVNIEGDVICGVPIDCFGVYKLFYSKINPEIGIEILNKGLAISTRKRYIAEDLGYIFRDEGRNTEAAEMFQISVDETPSSNYIYGELAKSYELIGENEQAEKFKKTFSDEDKGISKVLNELISKSDEGSKGWTRPIR